MAATRPRDARPAQQAARRGDASTLTTAWTVPTRTLRRRSADTRCSLGHSRVWESLEPHQLACYAVIPTKGGWVSWFARQLTGCKLINVTAVDQGRDQSQPAREPCTKRRSYRTRSEADRNGTETVPPTAPLVEIGDGAGRLVRVSRWTPSDLPSPPLVEGPGGLWGRC